MPTPSDAKKRNRERMPGTAALLDDIRAHLGDGSIAWFRLTENGITVEWGEHVPDAPVQRMPGVAW